MKKFLLFISILIMTGCAAKLQLIELKDGTVIQAQEVRYNETTEFYEFKDGDGKLRSINRDEIRQISEQ